MNFNILNSIPVVGHVKAAIHYANGDVTEGNRAMYEATRSTAVTCGSALGALGGPAGMAAMAVTAGTLTDMVASLATDTPEGVIAGVTGVVGDIIEGNDPTGSVLALGMCVSTDVLSGVGISKVTISTVKAAEVAGKNVTAEVFKTVARYESKAVIRSTLIGAAGTIINAAISDSNPDDTTQPNQNESNNSSTPNNDTNNPNPEGDNVTNSSGSDPPEEKENDNNNEHNEETLTHWEAFLLIFGVSSLDDICMGRFKTHIFQNLQGYQRRTLTNLISGLRRNGHTYFSRIISIVVELFENLDRSEVNFENFLNLVKFVQTYVGEEVARRNEEGRNTESFAERKKTLTDQVTGEILKNISDIWNKYRSLKFVILDYLRHIQPTFKTMVSAVYHYYKHRLVPGQSRVLSVEKYFNLIKSMLEKLKTLSQYSQLCNTDHPRREVVFERYMSLFGFRLKIVVKVQGRTITLSSCYFLDVFIEGDKEGDEYVDGKKIEENKEDEAEE